MKKQNANKSMKKKSLKNNKALLYTIVILVSGGMLLSLFLPYLLNATAPKDDDPSAILRSQIAQVETQITQYQALLEEDPEDVTALMQLGHAYYDLGQIYSSLNNAEDSQANFAQALEPYGKVLELTPDDVNVRVDRAVAAYLSRNNEVAQEEFEAAIKVDPAHAKARFNYGFFLYSALDKPQEALQQWQEVVELDPADEADVVATARTLIDMVEEELAEQANDGESSPEDDTSAEDTD